MKDTRSTEIKKILKKEYPGAKFSVRIDKYSMGESINVRTDAFHIDQVADPRGYGYINQASEKDAAIRTNIKELLAKYEDIDRDQWGEILSGGNTFLFVEEF
jgi:hypothetical protein